MVQDKLAVVPNGDGMAVDGLEVNFHILKSCRQARLNFTTFNRRSYLDGPVPRLTIHIRVNHYYCDLFSIPFILKPGKYCGNFDYNHLPEPATRIFYNLR